MDRYWEEREKEGENLRRGGSSVLAISIQIRCYTRFYTFGSCPRMRKAWGRLGRVAEALR